MGKEAEIVRMYIVSEYTVAELVALTGFSENRIRKLLKRNGVTLRKGTGSLKRRLSTTEIDRTIWLHEQQLSHKQMSEILGITVYTVRSRLAKIRKEYDGKPKSRRGCWGRAGEPTAIPAHVRKTVERWRAEDKESVGG